MKPPSLMNLLLGICFLREAPERAIGTDRRAGKWGLMAALIRWRTAASTEWIATRLNMGHPGSVSRQVGIVKKNRKLLKQLNEVEKM